MFADQLHLIGGYLERFQLRKTTGKSQLTSTLHPERLHKPHL